MMACSAVKRAAVKAMALVAARLVSVRLVDADVGTHDSPTASDTFMCGRSDIRAPVYSMLRAAFFITTVMLPVVRAAAPAMARTGCCECCSARGAFFAATRPRDEPASKVLLTT